MTARILIVDDVPANTRLLQAKLAAERYQAVSAEDGFAALRATREWHPDLILLDVMMPGMDGFECCRRLKADPSTLHIPVVMVTALSEPAERLRALEAGADDFLTKPVEYQTLLARGAQPGATQTAVGRMARTERDRKRDGAGERERCTAFSQWDTRAGDR